MTEDIADIGTELKMRRPFRSKSLEGSLGLLKTADVIRRHFDGVAEREGLTLQQYNVLRILRGAAPEGLPTLEVAERMVERAPGITRMLDRLMTKGFVTRERSTLDRRVVVCSITEEGLHTLDRLDEPMVGADDSALGMLSEQDQGRLIALLGAIRSGHAHLTSADGNQESP